MSVQEICDFIRADSLAYISIDGLYNAIDNVNRDKKNPQFCDACFTGDYAEEIVDQVNHCGSPSGKAAERELSLEKKA